jgi:fermentation-respiration switch protein FrsA (DUF1100 family)
MGQTMGLSAKKGQPAPGIVGQVMAGLESAAIWVRRQTLEPLIEVQLRGQIQMVTTPWFRSLLAYDPRPALRRVRVPVLALIGQKDVQVPPAENLKALRLALEEAGNKDVTLKEMPGLNHLFQPCKTGLPNEYPRIEETIAPVVLQEITDWIRTRTR